MSTTISKNKELQLESDLLNGVCRRPSLWARFIQSGPIVIGAAIMLLIVILAAVMAPYIAPHGPAAMNLRARHLPPVFLTGGKLDHLLGTDQLGRDILSRIMWGGQVSLVVGFGSVIAAGSLGVFLGTMAGYFGGTVDAVIMRFADIFLSIPFLLTAMAVVVLLGPSVMNLVLVLGTVRWTIYARMVRSQVLCIREREYVLAAKTSGVNSWRIMLRHVLPNAAGPIIVIGTLEMANMIIYESALSFLGLGVKPPQPTWGNMLSDGREYMMTAWWLATLPGLAIFLTVVALNVLGDWLRDVFDPTLRT